MRHIHRLHNARGCPLKDITVEMIQEMTFGVNYSVFGCFALQRNEDQFVKSVRHWSGSVASLAVPLAGEVEIVDNHHENWPRST